MDGIAPHEAADLADAGDRVQPIPGSGIMVLGGVDDGKRDVTEERIVRGDEGEIDCQAFLPRWSGTALGDSVAVGGRGDFFADGWQIVLTVRMVHACQECPALARQGHTSAQQGTGGAHGRGVDIGLRAPTTAQQGGNLVRIDLVIFGLAIVDGFHGEGMPQHEGNAFVSAEISEPIPGKDALNGYDQPLAIGGNGLEERFRSGFHVAVEHDVTLVAHDADIHASGMQVDPAVKLVRISVKSH
jgi:hypothetical protein